MEISSVQHQAMATHVDEVVSCPKSNQQLQQQQQETKKPRPHPEQALKCPRCDSSNTKFCYYNNYSLSQPRYFCKGCRRYWTRGGSLRNVPVGGGCRKNKRSSSSSSPNSSSSSSSSSSKKSQPDLITPPPLIPALPLPPLSFDPNDLTLAFANDTTFMLGNPNPSPSPSPNPGGFLDILRNPTGSFQNLYYGFGGEEVEGTGVSGDGHGHHLMMFPNFDGGGLMNNSDSAEAAENTVGFGAANGGCKGLMDHGGENNKGGMGTGLHQWPVGGGDHGSSLGLDWNGVGSASSWYGLINSSLM